MTCPDRAQLILFVDQELDAAEHAAAEAHTATCSACAKLLAQVTALDALLLADEAFAPGLRARLESIPRLERSAGTWRRYAAAAIVVLTVGTLAYQLLSTSDTVPSQRRAANREVAAVPAPSFPERVEAALRSVDAEERSWLDEVAPRALPIVCRLAKDEDVELARAAVRRLGRWRRIEALPLLRHALARPELRRAAIVALGRVGAARGIAALEAFLADGEHADLARVAIVDIGGARAAEALAKSFRNTRKTQLLSALAEVGGHEAAVLLTSRIAQGEDADRSALRALRSGGPALLRDVVALARGQDEDAAQHALRVLEALRPTDAVSELTPLLAHKTRRFRAARVLARIDTSEAVDALLRAPRAYELEAAFRLAERGAEEALLDRLRTGTRADKTRVARLLAHCGGPDAVAALEGLVQERALAPVAIASIGAIGGELGVEALERLARSPRLRLEVIAALGATGQAAAVPVLTQLAARHPSLRSRVVAALSQVSASEAVESIVVLDGRRRLRSQSARALATMEPALVRRTLVALLDTRHGASARYALGAMTTREATDSRFASAP